MIKDYDDQEGKVFEELNTWLDESVSLWSVILWSVLVAALALVVLFWPGTTAHAGEIPKGRAVNAIIGEAEREPYGGKLAVACALRNRGTLKGVFGERAPRVLQRKYSSKTLVASVRAWEESANKDNCCFINGATHWEGTAFKEPYWAKDMIVTATIGRQRFYKERSK